MKVFFLLGAGFFLALSPTSSFAESSKWFFSFNTLPVTRHKIPNEGLPVKRAGFLRSLAAGPIARHGFPCLFMAGMVSGAITNDVPSLRIGMLMLLRLVPDFATYTCGVDFRPEEESPLPGEILKFQTFRLRTKVQLLLRGIQPHFPSRNGYKVQTRHFTFFEDENGVIVKGQALLTLYHPLYLHELEDLTVDLDDLTFGCRYALLFF